MQIIVIAYKVVLKFSPALMTEVSIYCHARIFHGIVKRISI